METLFLVLRVVVALGVVLAVIWVAHRRVSRMRARTKRTGLVQLVARQSLAPKASMVIVDADGRRLVLGVTEHAVSVLSDRPAPVADADFDAVLAAAVAPDSTSLEASAVAPARTALEASASVPAPAASAAPSAPASHGSRRGSILSAETWKRSLAEVKEGLGI